MHRALLLMAWLVPVAIPQVARAARAPKVMVLDIPRDEAFKVTVVQAMNEFLSGAIRDQGFDVISSADITAALGVERQRQLLGCSEGSCMAEIGGALGASYLVHGTLAVLDQDSALTLSLVDDKGKALNQVRKLVKGKSADTLIPVIEELVPKLMAPIKPSQAVAAGGATAPAGGTPPAGSSPAAGGVISSQQATQSTGESHVLAYTFLGVGAAGLIASAVFGALASGAQGAVNTDARNGLYNTGNTSTLKTDALVSTITLGVGVVAAGVGGGLWLFGGSSDSGATPAAK